MERFREPAVEAGCEVTLTLEAEAPGCWDRVRIEQVVTNLLSNAIKYGAATSIDVRVAVDGSEAVLTVADRGPGIPEEALSRVFDRFERAASVRHYGGLGIGLYVTREIVSAHGGSIAAQNVFWRRGSLHAAPTDVRRGAVLPEANRATGRL